MDDLPLYEEIVRLKKSRTPAALATIVETRGSAPRKAGAKMLVRHDGSIAGTIGGGQVEADVITAAKEAVRHGKPRTLNFSLTEEHGAVCGGDMVIYLEPLVVPLHLIVVGSGHVGQAVSRAAHQAGFAVSLINLTEARSNMAMAEDVLHFSLMNLAKAFAEINVDDHTYIFIATSDHQQDFQAAAAALNTKACYIAVLGSRKKRAAMDRYLAGQGYPAAAIARIVSPAGLAIGAETPEEIAVSIVAQMIKMRRLDSAATGSHTACSGKVTADGVQQGIAALGR